MGTADLVPGVSGGTVALVVGIYPRLVGNIREGAGALASLLRWDLAGAAARVRTIQWRFLLPLLAGILTAIVALASLLSYLLETQPIAMSAVFLGLVVGAVIVSLRQVERWTPAIVTLAVASTVVTFWVLGFRTGRFEDPSLFILFGGGALAITAMILPGISGSFILLLLGLYDPVLGAVADRDLITVLVVGLGAATGLGLFSTFLDWLLERYRTPVLAVLIGLMAGSLRVLWPWPAGEDGVGDTALGPPGDDVWVALALAAGAAVVVAVVAATADRLDELTDPDG